MIKGEERENARKIQVVRELGGETKASHESRAECFPFYSFCSVFSPAFGVL